MFQIRNHPISPIQFHHPISMSTESPAKVSAQRESAPNQGAYPRNPQKQMVFNGKSHRSKLMRTGGTPILDILGNLHNIAPLGLALTMTPPGLLLKLPLQRISCHGLLKKRTSTWHAPGALHGSKCYQDILNIQDNNGYNWDSLIHWREGWFYSIKRSGFASSDCLVHYTLQHLANWYDFMVRKDELESLRTQTTELRQANSSSSHKTLES